ncbi:MAG: DUF4091 domain-containing protein [Deltaproteobacteria bacterium]|nr:DUF4091 domain-containing protein [Deltaproteobacteria bacterium]MBM4287001.1 DUF4091 domain-containing protein [Deltaproteobacteria bacterium]
MFRPVLLVLSWFIILCPRPAPADLSLSASGFPVYRLNPARPEASPAPIVLKLAGNEYALFLLQVAGAAPDQLKVELERPGGKPAVHLHVWQLRPLPAHLPSDLHADALVPLEPGLVLPGAPCYLAVRLKVPSAHAGGEFPCTLKVTGPGGTAAQPLHLTVRRFSLPDDLPITLMANFRPSREWFRRYGVAAPEGFTRVWEAYLKILREYKVNAIAGFAPLNPDDVGPGRPLTSFPEFTRMLDKIIREMGYRTFRLPVAAGAKAKGPDPERLKQQMAGYFPEMLRYLQDRGWVKRALVKLWDEPKREVFPQVAQTYSQFKAALPQVRTECTGFPPSPALTRAVDIWTVSARLYEAGAMDAARRQGQEVWVYNNRLQGADRPAAHQRLIGWQVFLHQFSGYYLWGVNVWPEDPWTEPPGPTAKMRRGTLLYPHPRTGLPLPTLRLEAMRQGWQDYQYLQLAEAAARQGRVPDAAWQDLRRQALALAGELTNVKPKVAWQDLEALRLKLGDLLEGASGGGRP